MELVIYIYIYIILDNQPSERIFPGCNSKKCKDNCELCSEEGRSKCSKCSSGYNLKVATGLEFSESEEGKTLINAKGQNVVILGNSCPDGYYEVVGVP